MADESKTYTQEEVDALVEQQLSGLKANQQELLKEAKAAKQRLAQYDGVDPAEYKALKDAAAEAERKKAAAEGDFKSLEEQLVKKYEGEKEQLHGEVKRHRTALEKYLVDAAAAAELAKHSDAPSLLMPHIRARMKVVEQDGEFHARVVDESGNIRIGKGQGSTPMTLTELVEEMKSHPDYAVAFRGTGSSGGGASKSNGSAGGSRVVPANDNAAFIANLDDIADGKTNVG